MAWFLVLSRVCDPASLRDGTAIGCDSKPPSLFFNTHGGWLCAGGPDSSGRACLAVSTSLGANSGAKNFSWFNPRNSVEGLRAAAIEHGRHHCALWPDASKNLRTLIVGRFEIPAVDLRSRGIVIAGHRRIQRFRLRKIADPPGGGRIFAPARHPGEIAQLAM